MKTWADDKSEGVCISIGSVKSSELQSFRIIVVVRLIKYVHPGVSQQSPTWETINALDMDS
jgi:hypothetical protein